jgi:hypothetical protein
MSYPILHWHSHTDVHQESSLGIVIVEDTATLARAHRRSIYEWFTVFPLSIMFCCFPMIAALVGRGGREVVSLTGLLL